ncbi:unnamed protein product [Schistosoma curassoni]|uniref:Uncharacterized protein n=1 Tax=Schistosoma curassoni TaxID=6186 RepID=A0A183JLS3_9TREM|nr:unnamed protein product [Schistosoma curassoni]
MRGRQAMRKERVRQYYQALLNRLDEVKRNEASLRRSQLYSETVKSSHVPGGGPFNDAVVNRRMEKVFEYKILSKILIQRLTILQNLGIETWSFPENCTNKEINTSNKYLSTDE